MSSLAGALLSPSNDITPAHLDFDSPPSQEPPQHVPQDAPQDDRISSPDRKHREAMEYHEQDEPEAVVEHVLEANAAIPNIPVPRTSDGNYWVIRMPNFVKLDSKPFHSDTYVGPEQEDDDAQQAETLREKSMSIKLKVENTVRWRWQKDPDGKDRRQSNSRIVRWSDGSLSLQLGKELFDITQTIDTSGAIPRQAFGSSSQGASQPPPTPSAPGKSQGLTYLVAQHKRAEILQCEALVTGYMSLRPTGMQSETHRMLVRAVGQKHNKVARLRMAPDPTVDPERERMEMLKIASRKPKKPRGEDDGLGGPKKRRASYPRRRTGEDMWSDDDDDEAAYGGGDSEDEFGAREGHSGAKAKRRKASKDESKKGPGDYQTDDFLVADSDEDDGGFGDSDSGSPRRKRTRRSHADAEEGGDDDLDRMEARIDQQESEGRRHRKDFAVASAAETDNQDRGEDAMDIESEEEDDDFGVRRARTVPGGRKKRAIGFDEEEEY